VKGKSMKYLNSSHIQCILFLAFILYGFSVFSQPAFVHGTAEGRHNELVRVIVYADQFSKLPKTIASVYTDDNGHFELKPEVQYTDYAFLALGLKKNEFYLKPGVEYRFEIPEDTAQKRGSVFDELPLQFSYKADDGGLSDGIGDFNMAYNTFIYKNASSVYRRADKHLITEFVNKMTGRYDSVDDSYLKNYIRYSLISLQWVSKMMSSDSVISTYFVNRPVLYHNIQYTEFFSNLFQSYFGEQNIFSYRDLINAINNGKGYDDVDKLLKKQKSLVMDDRLRELVGIKLISRKYYSNDVDKSKIIGLLKEIRKNSRFKENREVAGNYILKLQKLEHGTPAPDFSLKDINGQMVSLSGLSDKVLLMSFIRSDCKVCLEQIGMLDELKKKFGNKLKMVTLVYGKGFDDVARFASDRNFNWPFLNIAGNILLLEAYNIRTYPSYVILNPGGTIAMSTAPMPEENLEYFVRKFINRAEKTNHSKEH